MSDTLVQDSARRLFADLVPPATVNAAEEGTWPVALWDAVAEAGFPDALAASAETPGDLAGIGDAAAILREAGRHAAPLPLAESMLARWLLAGAGIEAPEGPLTIAPVERREAFTLRRSDGWRLSGKATGVPWAKQSAGIVVIADGLVALIPPARCRYSRRQELAGEPRDDVSVDAAVAAKPAPRGRRRGADLSPRRADAGA